MPISGWVSQLPAGAEGAPYRLSLFWVSFVEKKLTKNEMVIIIILGGNVARKNGGAAGLFGQRLFYFYHRSQKLQVFCRCSRRRAAVSRSRTRIALYSIYAIHVDQDTRTHHTPQRTHAMLHHTTHTLAFTAHNQPPLGPHHCGNRQPYGRRDWMCPMMSDCLQARRRRAPDAISLNLARAHGAPSRHETERMARRHTPHAHGFLGCR